MDVVLALETDARRCGGRPVPIAWRDDPCLAELLTIVGVVSAVRACDARSDRVLAALVERSVTDPTASVVAIAALMRLRVGRCGGVRERVDAFAGELAIVFGEAQRGELSLDGRRLANVITDRAWNRVRSAERKGRWIRPADPGSQAFERGTSVRSAEDEIVDRVTLAELQDSLAAARSKGTKAEQVAKAWDTAVELADGTGGHWRSESDRNRWRYARGVVRRHVTADLELVDLP